MSRENSEIEEREFTLYWGMKSRVWERWFGPVLVAMDYTGVVAVKSSLKVVKLEHQVPVTEFGYGRKELNLRAGSIPGKRKLFYLVVRTIDQTGWEL